MTDPTDVPAIRLHNGVEIPQLGFGTFKVDPDEAHQVTLAALDLGYRHLDTAQMYGNEAGVGQAVRDCGLERDEIFVTSKLNNGYHAYDDALTAFDTTMDDLGLDYLDLFLIHWPLPKVGDYVETWRAMTDIQESGRVRAIGVSNFQEDHLERILAESDTVPVVNQIEAHPYLTQDPLRSFNTQHNIVTQAWSPIARGQVMNDPVIGEIGTRYEKSAAQVTLRWHLQRGDVVFPKSTQPTRMQENFDVFDFALADEDMAAIALLNRNERTGADPATFNWIP